jgi:hypothetical protein
MNHHPVKDSMPFEEDAIDDPVEPEKSRGGRESSRRHGHNLSIFTVHQNGV